MLQMNRRCQWVKAGDYCTQSAYTSILWKLCKLVVCCVLVASCSNLPNRNSLLREQQVSTEPHLEDEFGADNSAVADIMWEGRLVLERLTPLEFLDALVYAASEMNHDTETTAVLVEMHDRTMQERRNSEPFKYITESDIPALIERLDSDRPALGVGYDDAKAQPGLSTESQQAAYLIMGYRKQRYPITESSDWFNYDPDYLRAWWELYRNDVVSCSGTEDSPDIFSDTELRKTAELDIMERLMWIQLERVYSDRTIDDYYYFVQVDGEDPDPELLERFSEHKPQVKAISKLEEIEYDEANLKRGHTIPGRIIEFRDLEWITPGCVEVYFRTYSGPLRASGGTYRLRLEQGKWVMIDAYDIWLS